MKSFLEWLESDLRRFAVVQEPMGHVMKVLKAEDLRSALKKLADYLEANRPRSSTVVSMEGEIGRAKWFRDDEPKRRPPDGVSRDGLPGGHWPGENPDEWPVRPDLYLAVVDLDADYSSPEAKEKQALALKEIDRREAEAREERENRERFERRAAKRAI